MTVLLVLAGGAIGAPARYLVDRAVQARHDTVFPWGTLTVNVAASFLLGLLMGWSAGTRVFTLVGVGGCGALSTYSTFGYETLRLVQDRSYLLATLNVTVSVVAAVGAASAGLAVSGAAWT